MHSFSKRLKTLKTAYREQWQHKVITLTCDIIGILYIPGITAFIDSLHLFWFPKLARMLVNLADEKKGEHK